MGEFQRADEDDLFTDHFVFFFFACIVYFSFCGLLLVTHSDSLLATSSTPPFSSPGNSTLLTFVSTLNEDDSPILSPITTAPSLPKNPLLGDALALLSAFCYAVYVILLKAKIGDEENVDMQLFFG